MWQRVVDKATARKIKRDKQRDADLAKKQEVVDTLVQSAPEHWLDKAIDKRIRAAKAKPKSSAKSGPKRKDKNIDDSNRDI